MGYKDKKRMNLDLGSGPVRYPTLVVWCLGILSLVCLAAHVHGTTSSSVVTNLRDLHASSQQPAEEIAASEAVSKVVVGGEKAAASGQQIEQVVAS